MTNVQPQAVEAAARGWLRAAEVAPAEAASLRPAVFLDRDGTIAEEVGYLDHISRFRMFPFAAQAIAALMERSYLSL